MSSFMKRVEKSVFDNTIARDSSTLNIFSILDAWGFFASKAKEYPQIFSCVLDIKREGDHYLIRMVMINQRGEPVAKNGDMVIGCKLIAYNLADDVVIYMKGRQMQYMHLSTLTIPPEEDDEE